MKVNYVQKHAGTAFILEGTTDSQAAAVEFCGVLGRLGPDGSVRVGTLDGTVLAHTGTVIVRTGVGSLVVLDRREFDRKYEVVD